LGEGPLLLQHAKKTSHKAEGQPKFRSIDEMLAQAITGEAFASLPGKDNPRETSPEQ